MPKKTIACLVVLGVISAASFARAAGDYWSASGNNIFYTDGRVGIGVTNPTAKLEIDGAMKGHISGAVRINTGKGTIDIGPKTTSRAHITTDRSKFYFNTELRVDTGLIGSYDEDLRLATQGAERIRVSNTTGNVGIGITDPSEKLDVDGAIQIGTTANTNPGNIRWTGTDFEGYDGSTWRSFTNGIELGSRMVSVCASGCDYTSVETAASSVTGTVSMPIVIYVGPGIYIDQTVTLGDYESIVGAGDQSTIIDMMDSTGTGGNAAVTGGNYSQIRDITILGGYNENYGLIVPAGKEVHVEDTIIQPASDISYGGIGITVAGVLIIEDSNIYGTSGSITESAAIEITGSGGINVRSCHIEGASLAMDSSDTTANAIIKVYDSELYSTFNDDTTDYSTVLIGDGVEDDTATFINNVIHTDNTVATVSIDSEASITILAYHNIMDLDFGDDIGTHSGTGDVNTGNIESTTGL